MSGLSRPSFLRICSTASLFAAGPAKYAAGSPGSARVKRNVTITTPIRLGIANINRLPVMVSMVALRLHQRAIIEATMEPVLIARDVLLHRDVDVGLIQRNARNICECQVDETLHILLVSRPVPRSGGVDCAMNEVVHRLRLVAHGVEDRILSVVTPDEEVFGIVEPAGEHVGVKRKHLLVELGPPVGARNLVDRGLDSDLSKTLLHQHAERLVYAGKSDIS